MLMLFSEARSSSSKWFWLANTSFNWLLSKVNTGRRQSSWSQVQVRSRRVAVDRGVADDYVNSGDCLARLCTTEHEDVPIAAALVGKRWDDGVTELFEPDSHGLCQSLL